MMLNGHSADVAIMKFFFCVDAINQIDLPPSSNRLSNICSVAAEIFEQIVNAIFISK